jgi:hypothetical protein
MSTRVTLVSFCCNFLLLSKHITTEGNWFPILPPMFRTESSIGKSCLSNPRLLFLFLLCNNTPSTTGALDMERKGIKPCLLFVDIKTQSFSGFRGLDRLHGQADLCDCSYSHVRVVLLQLELVVRIWCDVAGALAKSVWIGATLGRRPGYLARCRWCSFFVGLRFIFLPVLCLLPVLGTLGIS